MKEYLARGVAAAEAARLAADAETPRSGADTTTPAIPAPETTAAAPPPLQAAGHELAGALDRFDEEQAHAVLDRLLAAYRIETILRDLLVPYLHDLGERWAGGEVSVAQEHFASNLLRGRLLGLARGWGQGHGPTAVLACLPGEQHDLGLIAFGITLYRRGWRIIYLGPDTPIATIGQATERIAPDLVVLAGTVPEPLPPTPMPSPTSPGRPWWPSAAPARPPSWPPGPERTCWTRTRSAWPSIWTATPQIAAHIRPTWPSLSRPTTDQGFSSGRPWITDSAGLVGTSLQAGSLMRTASNDRREYGGTRCGSALAVPAWLVGWSEPGKQAKGGDTW
jgi:methanogenic corrinoid protein MtbC1